MSDKGWPWNEFNKEPIRKPRNVQKENRRIKVVPDKEDKEPVREPRSGIIDRLKNFFMGSNPPPEDIVKEPDDPNRRHLK